MTTTIVIPCYNEADRLNVQAFLDYSSSNPNVVLRFVDDGSRDATLKMLNELADASRGRCIVQHLERNVGKAEAVRTGMRSALVDGSEFIGFWDADLATPLDAIEQFARVMRRDDKLEAVFGSRMPLMGRKIERTAVRAWCGRLFAFAASCALGTRIFDSQCGAKLFRVNRQFRAWVARPFVSRWIFDVEILARMQWLYRRDHHQELERLFPSKVTQETKRLSPTASQLEFDGPTGTYRIRTEPAADNNADWSVKRASRSELVDNPQGDDELPGPLVLPPVETVRRTVYEYPLENWHDVAGSKLKPRDFVRAVAELATIYFGYRWWLMGDWTRQTESTTVDPADAPTWLSDEPLEAKDWRRKPRRAA